MRWFLLLSMALFQLVSDASAQTADMAHPKTPIHFAFVEMQANGNLLVRQTQWVPETQSQNYTVNVPVQETRTRTVEGKEVTYTVTVHRQESRTREITVLKSVPVSQELQKGTFSLYQMSGRKLSAISLQGQPAVLVGLEQKLDTWYRKIIRPNTVVVRLEYPKKLPATEIVPAPAG